MAATPPPGIDLGEPLTPQCARLAGPYFAAYLAGPIEFAVYMAGMDSRELPFIALGLAALADGLAAMFTGTTEPAEHLATVHDLITRYGEAGRRPLL